MCRAVPADCTDALGIDFCAQLARPSSFIVTAGLRLPFYIARDLFAEGDINLGQLCLLVRPLQAEPELPGLPHKINSAHKILYHCPQDHQNSPTPVLSQPTPGL
jgi:hypothetical protein